MATKYLAIRSGSDRGTCLQEPLEDPRGRRLRVRSGSVAHSDDGSRMTRLPSEVLNCDVARGEVDG